MPMWNENGLSMTGPEMFEYTKRMMLLIRKIHDGRLIPIEKDHRGPTMTDKEMANLAFFRNRKFAFVTMSISYDHRCHSSGRLETLISSVDQPTIKRIMRANSIYAQYMMPDDLDKKYTCGTICITAYLASNEDGVYDTVMAKYYFKGSRKADGRQWPACKIIDHRLLTFMVGKIDIKQ